ncbi:uncharacterized protein FFB14_11539 [Fusarium fujikuroi]|nr:uncharacterized protein FFB14_11539 [Fusarium fujikuroi]
MGVSQLTSDILSYARRASTKERLATKSNEYAKSECRVDD